MVRQEMCIAAVRRRGLTAQGFLPVGLVTSRGTVDLRHYPAGAGARAGVVFMGGVAGGWDSPADGLYPRLASELAAEGITGVRVRFRHSTVLDACVEDALAAVQFLESAGCRTVAVVGHSFGAAVALQAAARSDLVHTVVTLATQSHGARAAAMLGSRSVLLVHGSADWVLPVACSEYVQQLVPGPHRLVRLAGAGHSLDEAADEVHYLVRAWLTSQLNDPAAQSAHQ